MFVNYHLFLSLFLKLNENLVKNQEIWKAKISEIEERYVWFIKKAVILCLDFALLCCIHLKFFYKTCDVKVQISFQVSVVGLTIDVVHVLKILYTLAPILHFSMFAIFETMAVLKC